MTFIQRHGSALNLNVHTHILARPRFHRVAPPAAEELKRLHDTLIRRITRTLLSSGALVAQTYDDGEQLWLDMDPDGEYALTQLQDASIRYRIAVGPIAGRKTLRLHTPGVALEGPGREQTKPFPTARDGFSLNAAVACNARERRKLELLCRYVARPVIALERLSRDGAGLVVYALKHPFRDGTTHVCCTGTYECRGRQDAGSGLFEPLDFFARLAALVPRPRTHLVRFHGLFAPNARHRRLVVPGPAPEPVHDDAETTRSQTRAAMTWAQRLHRVFAIDISQCPHCGAPLRVLVCAVQGCTNVAAGRQGLLLQFFCISAIHGGQMPGATSPTRG